MISIARDGQWTASRPVIYGTYVGTVCAHGAIAIFLGKVMPKIQSICIYLNIGLVVATAIALPIGKHENSPPINSGAYVFGQVENFTTWPDGWAFMLAWLSPIWTIGAFDSCVHMSEEATHATRAVPLGMIASSGLCGILGFLSLAIIAASMNKDIEGILGSNFGQPMAQVYCPASLLISHCSVLTQWAHPDLLRCAWQARRPWLHGRSSHSPILHGLEYCPFSSRNQLKRSGYL